MSSNSISTRRNIMISERDKKIRLYIHKLCETTPYAGLASRKNRNEKIISRAMKEFGISRQEAEHHFMHNNDLED